MVEGFVSNENMVIPILKQLIEPFSTNNTNDTKIGKKQTNFKTCLIFLSVIICLNTIIFFRANASLNLESQIKKVDGLVSGFEKKLSEDGPIPDVPNAIKSHSQDIQVRKSSFAHSFKILPLPHRRFDPF